MNHSPRMVRRSCLLGISLFSLLALLVVNAQAAGFSLRFHGNGVAAPDQDRVKIPIDNPPLPADIGASDFTLEFWMKTLPGENSAATCSPGNDNWITGNIMLDRDVNGPGDFGDYGISLFSSGLAFGVASGANGGNGICGTTNVADGQWHHIAVTRNATTGQLGLFVDGMLDAEGAGPSGDVSYRDDRPDPAPNDPFLVLGAEKHDAGAQYPSYSGWIDEVRLSNTIRYVHNFTRPAQPFTPDANTMALYHFDEGSGNAITDASGAPGGPSDGTRNFGGSPAGPEWSTGVPHFGAPAAIALTEIATGLAQPVSITHAGDGSGRLFITLQGGKIVIYNGTQTLLTFLDITSLVQSVCPGGACGLFSIAFHPNYPTTPYFYVNYTRNPDRATVIARYTVSADNSNIADQASAVVLLTVPEPFSIHNGGQLQFGPDRYLYIGMGDGGSDDDSENRAQNLGDLLGKMLRIDVDGGPPYSIPADNPFVEQPIDDPSTLGEIWTWGFRNPWRFAFDRQRGDMFIADVGQRSWEEVSFQPRSSSGGENYGWRLMEGSHCFNPPSDCNDGTLVLPIIEYDHSAGKCAVIGGYRYRGSLLPHIYGIYFYADFCTGQIWGATPNGLGGWTTTRLLDAPFFISSFGQDQGGNLYVADYSSGKVNKITGTSTGPTLVDHYYTAILRRPPDPTGKTFWEGEVVRTLALGMDLKEAYRVMAGQFFDSPEYLSFNRSNSDFVTDLYRTFFQRDPDAGGMNFWLGQLNTGLPRDIVMVSFLFSAEFASFMTSLYGDTGVRAEVDTVVDFYRGILGRLADDAGFAFWLNRLRTAQCQGAAAVIAEVDSISSQFIESAEYVGRARDNAQYVADLYYAFLRRGADSTGYNFWLDWLNSGARTRDELRQDFIQSQEFQGRVGAILSEGCLP